jgi:hypothetical protein
MTPCLTYAEHGPYLQRFMTPWADQSNRVPQQPNSKLAGGNVLKKADSLVLQLFCVIFLTSNFLTFAHMYKRLYKKNV